MTTTNNKALIMLNANDYELHSMASRTRTAELKLLWRQMRNAMGRRPGNAQQRAVTAAAAQEPSVANDESFQRAA